MINQVIYRNNKRYVDHIYFLKCVHRGIRQRCISKSNKSISYKYYYGKKFCTLEQFIDRFKNDKIFYDLWEAWRKNPIYKNVPSIDRLNNNIDYYVDNLQFVTHGINAGKDKVKLPILMYDLKGNFIREWESKWAAHKALNIPNGNIVKVCYGERKSAGGYVFRFKKT